MIVTKLVISVVIGWAAHLVAAQENVCSSFCSSVGVEQNNPGKSCKDIYEVNEASRGRSDNYWIKTATGVHKVFCDMELECGGEKGGWMRIADLDTGRGDNCPTGWTKITTPNASGRPKKVVCRSTNTNIGCHSTYFTVSGASFDKVCGKVRGYQKGSPDGFYATHTNVARSSINEPYMDGLSITLINSQRKNRKHVWTYAAGYLDGYRSGEKNRCPCIGGSVPAPDSFLKNHYYCESGTTQESWDKSNYFFTGDPLWDGSGCVSSTNNCCANAGLPWFYRQFPTAQHDDVEVRSCTDQGYYNEAVVIDQLQLFVQ